jgi:hypothetical protein
MRKLIEGFNVFYRLDLRPTVREHRSDLVEALANPGKDASARESINRCHVT